MDVIGKLCAMIRSNAPAILLAPMDGVTDSVMRRLLCARMPFSGCVSEFVRVSALVPPNKVFTKSIPELTSGSVTSEGTPVAVQLLGGHPERLALSAQRAVSLGASSIDLNFGCPAPTVNRHDGGATLLQFPERIEEIVKTVRQYVPLEIPVSAKFRLGWEDPQAIYQNAERAAKAGASWIAIHGRTKMQGYTPPAFWRPIGDVNRSLDIPVIANGEIWYFDDFKRCQEITGCEHFMLGRGVLANPHLVGQVAQYLRLPGRQSGYNQLNAEQVWGQIVGDTIWISRTQGEAERRTLSRIKQWLNYAHKRGSVSWFDAVKRCRDVRELCAALAIQGITVSTEGLYRCSKAA